MQVDDEIRSLVTKATDSKTIKQAAMRKGMNSLRGDGARKVLAGITSVEEVLRQMAEHKWGTTVVVDGDKPVGIVTTTDALRLCVDLLENES